jgi:hypothetical protein
MYWEPGSVPVSAQQYGGVHHELVVVLDVGVVEAVDQVLARQAQ